MSGFSRTVVSVAQGFSPGIAPQDIARVNHGVGQAAIFLANELSTGRVADMDPITGAVVIAGLKYVGQPSAQLVLDFLGRVIFPAGDAIGDTAAHPIVEWQRQRTQRAAELVMSAAVKVQESGQTPQAVAGRVLHPILQQGSLEEEPSLQEMWASLLASAALDPSSVPPSFPKILSELSPLDALVLEWISSEVLTPDAESPITLRKAQTTFGTTIAQMLLVIFNLDRLNLIISSDYLPGITEEGSQFMHLQLSPFGAAFVHTCRLPKSA